MKTLMRERILNGSIPASYQPFLLVEIENVGTCIYMYQNEVVNNLLTHENLHNELIGTIKKDYAQIWIAEIKIIDKGMIKNENGKYVACNSLGEPYSEHRLKELFPLSLN